MMTNTDNAPQRRPGAKKTRSAGLALTLPVALAAIFGLLPVSQAADNWDVEGANGSVYVYGALSESACRLEMSSERQEVDLGFVPTGRLQRAGDQGTPVHFELRLMDCLRSPLAHNKALTWAADHPAVTVSFRSMRDTFNPQLVKARGVEGMGLRIEDAKGNDVNLGRGTAPLLLTAGQNTLNFTVTPERTSAALMAGSYWSLVDFHLSYE